MTSHEDELGYCVCQLYNTRDSSNCQIYRTSQLRQQCRKTGAYNVMCTKQQLRLHVMNHLRETVRVRRTIDGRITYSKIIVHAVFDTEKEAKTFVVERTKSRGRGARVKVPKRIEHTPNEVTSVKKKRNIIEKFGTATTIKKAKKTVVEMANKSIEKEISNYLSTIASTSTGGATSTAIAQGKNNGVNKDLPSNRAPTKRKHKEGKYIDETHNDDSRDSLSTFSGIESEEDRQNDANLTADVTVDNGNSFSAENSQQVPETNDGKVGIGRTPIDKKAKKTLMEIANKSIEEKISDCLSTIASTSTGGVTSPVITQGKNDVVNKDFSSDRVPANRKQKEGKDMDETYNDDSRDTLSPFYETGSDHERQNSAILTADVIADNGNCFSAERSQPVPETNDENVEIERTPIDKIAPADAVSVMWTASNEGRNDDNIMSNIGDNESTPNEINTFQRPLFEMVVPSALTPMCIFDPGYTVGVDADVHLQTEDSPSDPLRMASHSSCSSIIPEVYEETLDTEDEIIPPRPKIIEDRMLSTKSALKISSCVKTRPLSDKSPSKNMDDWALTKFRTSSSIKQYKKTPKRNMPLFTRKMKFESFEINAEATSNSRSPMDEHSMYDFSDEDVNEDRHTETHDELRPVVTATTNWLNHSEEISITVQKDVPEKSSKETPNESGKSLKDIDKQVSSRKNVSKLKSAARKKKLIPKEATVGSHQCCDLGVKLLKFKKVILAAINRKSRQPLSTADEENDNGKTDTALPTDIDDDGKITILNDIRLDAVHFSRAADAPNIKKRINALIEAMWTLEERLNLCLWKKSNSTARVITSMERKNLIDVCVYLNRYQKLKGSEKVHIVLNINKWISSKLKSDRYRNSQSFKKKQTENRKKKKKPRNDNKQGSDKSSDDEVPRRKRISTKLNCAVVDTDRTDSSNDNKGDSSDDKTMELGIRSLKKLLQLLVTYPMKENKHDELEKKLLTWDELRRKTKFTESELKNILTPDTHVVINGYCRIVDIHYENKAVLKMCKSIQTSKYQFHELLYEATKKMVVSEMPEEVTKYIFFKYTVPAGKVCEETGQALYRLSQKNVCSLRMHCFLENRPKWKCKELIAQCRKAPFCDATRCNYNKLLNFHGTVSHSDDNDEEESEITRYQTLSQLDGVAIITRNYRSMFE